MTSALVMLVLTLWHAWSPGSERSDDARRIAWAIARAVDGERQAGASSWQEDARLMAYYALKESGVQLAPRPIAWDPKVGISCGPWQMRCNLVEGQSVRAQARLWLRLLHAGSLEGLDSSPKRAAKRRSIALGTVLQ